MLVHQVYLVYLVCLVDRTGNSPRRTRQTRKTGIPDRRARSRFTSTGDLSSLPAPVPSCLESDAAGFGCGGSATVDGWHRTRNECGCHGIRPFVPTRSVSVRARCGPQHLTHFHKRPDHIHADLDRSLRIEHTRHHHRAVFGKVKANGFAGENLSVARWSQFATTSAFSFDVS